jgi:hypothetical protein
MSKLAAVAGAGAGAGLLKVWAISNLYPEINESDEERIFSILVRT